MKRLPMAVWIVVFALVSASPLVLEAGQDPSSPEARATARELTAQLEQQPLGESAKKARKWLMIWVTKAPDISINVCQSIVGPLLEEKGGYAGELMTQTLFSAAVFVLDHPDRGSDEAAKQLAGVEGMLRAYESLLGQKPKARIAYLDELLAKRDAGTLATWVQEQTEKCNAN